MERAIWKMKVAGRWLQDKAGLTRLRLRLDDSGRGNQFAKRITRKIAYNVDVSAWHTLSKTTAIRVRGWPIAPDVTGTYDSFECAVQGMAPVCAHCSCRILGHGVEVDSTIYCCAHCARAAGRPEVTDRAEHH